MILLRCFLPIFTKDERAGGSAVDAAFSAASDEHKLGLFGSVVEDRYVWKLDIWEEYDKEQGQTIINWRETRQ